MGRFFSAAALLALTLLLVPTPGHAADDPVKLLKTLQRTISDLGKAASRLDAGDEREIKQLRASLKKPRDLLDDLKPFDGQVDGLKRLIADYKADLDRTDDALAALLGMAELTGRIDPLIGECEDIESEFTRFMQDVVQTEDAEVDDIEKHAGDVSGVVQGYLDEAEETIEAMERLHRTAARPGLRHKDFKPVDRALIAAADELLEQEQDMAEMLVDTCEQLVDYEDHPGYETAFTFLVDRDQAIEDFLGEGELWLKAHEDIGPELCAGMRKIREAFCALDPEPNDDDPRQGAYEDTVAKFQNQFMRRIDKAIADYDRNLAGVGKNLSQYDGNAERLYDRLRKRAAYYYYLQRAEELRNMNNVANRLWILYGRERHEDMQTASYCHVVEKYIPGAGGKMRVDCVDVAQCIVWEIKSDGHNKSSGQSQADGYARAINDWMEKEWDKAGAISPARGGPRRGMGFDDDFLEQAVANYCLVNGEGQFEGKLLTYPRCREDIELLCEPQPK